jgi:hypothetical protein
VIGYYVGVDTLVINYRNQKDGLVCEVLTFQGDQVSTGHGTYTSADNLHRFVVPNIAGPTRLVPLRALVGSDLSYEALRQAARRGRLDAHQGSDGVWRSTGKAVESYVQQRHSRR